MTLNQKCRACQWWNANKEDGFCDSCRPLVERYGKKIKEKYDTKRIKILEKEYKEEINLFPIDSLKKQISINQESADDYAIEFAEWVSDNCTEIQKTGNYKGKYFLLQKGDFFTSKEVLQIFKKEKGL